MVIIGVTQYLLIVFFTPGKAEFPEVRYFSGLILSSGR
jgi:hypothetical protein